MQVILTPNGVVWNIKYIAVAVQTKIKIEQEEPRPDAQQPLDYYPYARISKQNSNM
jgi:hypothetical protein